MVNFQITAILKTQIFVQKEQQKRFHVYNKTDHKPQVSQKGQEKMWAKNRDRKQCQKEEFYSSQNSSSPVDAIELLI